MLSAKEACCPGRPLALTRTCSSTGTKQTTLRRRLGSRASATRLPSSRRRPSRPTTTTTTKETPAALRLVLRCRRQRTAAKEASSTKLLLRLLLRLRLGLGLLLLLVRRRHRRIAKEATARAGLCRILGSRPTAEKAPARRGVLRAGRGSAAAREQSAATSWLRGASVASAEEARPGVLTRRCAWLRAKQRRLRARCARPRVCPSIRRR